MTEELHWHLKKPQLISEYLFLDSPEDRLMWLSERAPLHPPFPIELATPERRVPGCMSGLWLESTRLNDLFIFMAHSDSSIVGGIASLLCDLYSGLKSEEIKQTGDSFIKQLKLETLITPTRRNAIQKVFLFFQYSADH